jgi:hypothetical protein
MSNNVSNSGKLLIYKDIVFYHNTGYRTLSDHATIRRMVGIR